MNDLDNFIKYLNELSDEELKEEIKKFKINHTNIYKEYIASDIIIENRIISKDILKNPISYYDEYNCILYLLDKNLSIKFEEVDYFYFKDVTAILIDCRYNISYAYVAKYEEPKDIIDLYFLSKKTLSEKLFKEIFVKIRFE
jgi:hypothetical protein